MLNDTVYHEKELLALIANGDETAFSRLFEYYRNRIYSIAFKLTHSTAVSEEIVQDVFLKIWLKRADLTGIQNFSAYLFIVARNTVYKVLKRNAIYFNSRMIAEENQILLHKDPEHLLMEKDYNSLLQKAIHRLPAQQQKVYKLVKEQGLKREEVAELLEIHPETIKYHLAQAKKNIRTYCSPFLDLNMGIIFFLFYEMMFI